MTSYSYPPPKQSAHEVLVAALESYAMLSQHPEQKEACRRLAWFLGDAGQQEAANAIMKHAKIAEYAMTPWGYMAVPNIP